MENAAGHIVRGDQLIFIDQIREGAHLTAGKFMQGEFPVMMFGLAAALAIYHTAKPENKKVVAGLMGSAALTSFLTGITEPLRILILICGTVALCYPCTVRWTIILNSIFTSFALRLYILRWLY